MIVKVLRDQSHRELGHWRARETTVPFNSVAGSFAFLCALLCASAAFSGDSTRPNLLLIVTDDMGTQLGAYGDRFATTPHIDALAAAGIRFDRAYSATASCTPSRGAIYTGMPPHANGQWGFGARWSFHSEILTAPTLIEPAGYFTGLIGKRHVFAAEGQFAFDVQDLLRGNGRESPTAIGRAVGDFLKKSADRPFFLVVGTKAPHTPYPGTSGRPPWPEPHDPDAIPGPATGFNTPKFRLAHARMYDAYSLADAAIGAVLEALRAAGKERSTLVILTSDHGPAISAGKATLFEGGIRVPLIARWPGMIEPGRSTNALVSGIDILPTLLVAVGRPIHPQIQGRSFLDSLTNAATPSANAVYSEQNFLASNRYFPQRAVLTAGFKYIRNLRTDVELQNNVLTKWSPAMLSAWYTDPRARFLLERQVRPPREELYDLDSDPDELANLAGDSAYSARLEQMRVDLRNWMKRTGDPWLELWDFDGSQEDPFDPFGKPGGPLQRKWLDNALRAYHPLAPRRPTQKSDP